MKEKIRILIVDDEPMYIDMARVILEQAGYDILHCFEGLSAVDKAKKESPDLILLDIVMPMMDGIKVCEILKLSEETASIPVVMCTARDDVGAVDKSFENGAVDYIMKPYDAGGLVEKVRRNLC